MNTRERRTVFLPRHIDDRIAELAAKSGNSHGTQLRAIVVAAVETPHGNGVDPQLDLDAIGARLDRLEVLQRDLARLVQVQGRLHIQLLAGLRAVLQELAEGSIEPAHRSAWLQKLEARRSAEMEAILVELEAMLETGR